jgi:hypothetical protein
MVDLAVASMALVVFAKHQRESRAMKAAHSSYLRLLRFAQQVLGRFMTSQLGGVETDACLLAVSLMERYEGAVYSHDAPDTLLTARGWCHNDGAMAVLKMWSDSTLGTEPSFIIKRTRRELIKSLFLRNLPVPTWMLDGKRFGECGGELDFDRIFVRTICLHYAIATLWGNPNHQSDVIVEMYGEAKDLERALNDWALNIPIGCSPRWHTVTKVESNRHIYSSTVCSYPEPRNAAA